MTAWWRVWDIPLPSFYSGPNLGCLFKLMGLFIWVSWAGIGPQGEHVWLLGQWTRIPVPESAIDSLWLWVVDLGPDCGWFFHRCGRGRPYDVYTLTRAKVKDIQEDTNCSHLAPLGEAYCPKGGIGKARPWFHLLHSSPWRRHVIQH